MNRNVPNKQSGFVLLAVVLAITVLAAIAFALSHQGASQVNTAAGELQSDQLRYVSEAGLHHAKWQLSQNTSCSAYGNVPLTNFGGDSYSATISPNANSPVTITATGTLASGVETTLVNSAVRTYQAPTTVVLQMGNSDGKDTMIDRWFDTKNYGALDVLIVRSDPSRTRRPLLEFDLSAMPAGVRIISAQLELEQRTVSVPGVISAHRVTRSWLEGTQIGAATADGASWLTYDGSTSWGKSGGDFASTVYSKATISTAKNGGWVAWNIRDLVDEWVSGLFPNHGLMLVGDGVVDSAEFNSREGSDPASAPKLTIVYSCECGVSGSSSTLVLQPPAATGKDTFLLNGSKSNNNTGSGKQLWVSDSGLTQHHALVEFDISSLPAGAPVMSATLSLYDGGPDEVGAGTEIGIHRVTRDWVEGSGGQTGTNPADGASWDAYNGVNAWTSTGGDHDPLTIDSSPVIDTAARWHHFDATALVSDWVTGTQPNHGVLVKVVSGDLTKTHLVSSDDVSPALHPKLTIDYSCPCGTVCSFPGSGSGPKQILFVVGDPASLTAEELAHQALVESWGHSVELIDDDASQADFDTAAANNDVAFTTNDITASSLGVKLVNTTIGVVTSENNLSDEFGMASSIGWDSGTVVEINDNTHYITSPFATGLLTILSTSESLAYVSGTISADLGQLASSTSGHGIVTLESGASMYSGGSAAGRRVQLPWGGNGFDPNNLNVDGLTILQRAIEWGAAEAALPPAGPPPPGYLDQFNNGTCDAADYTGSDGALDWSPWAWTEINESDDSCAGQIQVAEDSAIPDPESFRLRVTGTSVRVYRMADLSSFSNPRLSFNYRLENYPTDDFFRIRVTVDDLTNPDSVTWTEIGRYIGPFDHSEYQTASFDLKPFIDVDTIFQLEFNGLGSTNTSYFDNFYIYDFTGVVFEEVTQGTLSGASNALVVAKPAGTVTGDLLIAAVAVDGKKTNSLAAPAGWNVVNVGEEPVDAGQVTLGVWWKLADAGETADYTFTWSANESAYGMVMRFTGHDPVNPINVSSVAGGVSGSPGSPAVTTTVPNTMILRLGGFDDDDINIGNPGLPGHTAITMGKSSSGNGTASGGAGYTIQEAAGDSGISTFTLTKAEEYRTVTIAIAPAP